MKKMVPVLIMLAVLGGGAALWFARRPGGGTHQHRAQAVYYCPMHPTYTSNKPGDCPICNMKLVKREPTEGSAAPAAPAAEAAGTPSKKILYWTDPMLPGYKSDKPGKSPMGMDLVPVYEEASGAGAGAAAPSGYAPILVTPQKQQLIGVKTAVAEQRPLTKTIRTVGIVAHDPELYQAQAEFLEALKAAQRVTTDATPEARASAERLVELSRLRLRHLGWSPELIDELAQQGQLDHSLLIGRPGGRVWIYGAIYEYELPLVHVGDQVQLEMTALGNRQMVGTLRSIDPMIDEMTRTARIRVSADDPDGLLKPEMYVNLTIVADLGEVLIVPKEAILHTGERHILFVDKGQGVFEPRDVQVGTTAGDVVEVQSGVAAGERVVVSGNFLIDSESRLKGALEGMGGQGHHHGQ